MSRNLSPRPRALLMVALLLAAPALSAAHSLVYVDGVLDAGIITAGHSVSRGASGGADERTPHEETNRSASQCVIDLFGVCWFTFEEEWEEEHEHADNSTWYWYESEGSNQTGYYVTARRGLVDARLAGGETDRHEGAGSTSWGHHYDRDSYDTNVAYSEDHVAQRDHEGRADASSDERVSRYEGHARLNHSAARVDADLEREHEGTASSENHEASRSSSHTEDHYFGLPVLAQGEESRHALDESGDRAWNRTRLDAAAFVVSPLGGTRVEILGLDLDKGDEQDAWSSDRADDDRSYTEVFGLEVVGSRSHSEQHGSRDVAREWLRLLVDVANGTVVGDVDYDRGTGSWSDASYRRDEGLLLGIPAGTEASSSQETDRTWRNLTLALDAASGYARVTGAHWDEDGRTRTTSEDNLLFAGVPFGQREESQTTWHSDGARIALDAAGGWLSLGIAYVNRTEATQGRTDYQVAGTPLFATTEDRSEASRRAEATASSAPLGLSAQAHHENRTAGEGQGLGVGGQDIARTRESTWSTSYGAAARAPEGLLAFELLYQRGTSETEVLLAGAPLGMRNDTRELRASAEGGAAGPDGGRVLAYSVLHREAQEETAVYGGPADVGRMRRNATETGVSFVLLDGLASAGASRSVSTTQFIAGEDQEVLDLSTDRTEARASAGSASAEAGTMFVYADAVDAIAVAALLATWCARPGPEIDAALGGAVASAAGALDDGDGPLPGEAGPAVVLAYALARTPLCAGLPVPLPLFLLSPCVLVPVAFLAVFVPLGAAVALVPPPAGPTASAAVGSAQATLWNTYSSSPAGCLWMTLPAEARNPQGGVAALDAATGRAEEALAATWPVLDGARASAHGVVDAVTSAERGVDNPEGTLSPISPPPLPEGS